jgi:hypothetical protein
MGMEFTLIWLSSIYSRFLCLILLTNYLNALVSEDYSNVVGLPDSWCIVIPEARIQINLRLPLHYTLL